MDYLKELFLVGIGAVLGKIADKLFMSKKDSNEYAIKLIETLQKEIDRLNQKQEEMEREYKGKYDTLLRDYNKLQGKYDNLKRELENYRKEGL